MLRHSRFLVAFVIICTNSLSRARGEVIPAPQLVTSPVNEAQWITLHGNVRPELNTAVDLGPVSEARPMEHVLLQLRRAPDREKALEQFLAALHDPASPNYHKWITIDEFQQRFGLAPQDIAAVTGWLQSHGLTINALSPNLTVDFSGTAGEVAAAFHTSIHSFQVGTAEHIANATEPQVPAALAAVIAGPVSLSDFRPRPSATPRAALTLSSTIQLVVPGDLQKIYNFNPLYSAGVSGKGQQIAVVEDSDLYSAGDWNTFRKTLGLALKYGSGKLVIEHPTGPGGSCADPGDGADDSEATIDAEWATATAPDATILLASCASTATTSGVFTALENLLTSANPPNIISISYVESEADLGSAGNAYVNALYQLAVARGISIFVASGDGGAATSDMDAAIATHGIEANGLASTPNNVAVGGTDFADSFFGENTTYWSSTNNPVTFASALSYIPEAPWNDSCASKLISDTLGYNTTYGASGFCNSTIAQDYGFVNTAAGGGAPSGCATGDASIFGVVSGTCAGYRKPSYQALVFGNPSDNVRDVPDVSLFAANGVWGHYYVVCYSNPAGHGLPCISNPGGWAGFGGTSVATPVMAALQALVNQATGSAQGNANYTYYRLAAAQYGTSGDAACNSTLGNAIDSGCIFHDVTFGDIDVPCQASTSGALYNCYYPSTGPGTFGVLSSSNTTYEPAYPSYTGWDFATGIGSVNAYNLVSHWPGSRLASVLSASR